MKQLSDIKQAIGKKIKHAHIIRYETLCFVFHDDSYIMLEVEGIGPDCVKADLVVSTDWDIKKEDLERIGIK